MGQHGRWRVLGLVLSSALVLGAMPIGMALADQTGQVASPEETASSWDAGTVSEPAASSGDVEGSVVQDAQVDAGDAVVQDVEPDAASPSAGDSEQTATARSVGQDAQGGGGATIVGSTDLPSLAAPSSDVPVGTSAGDLVGTRRVVSLKEEFSAVIDGEVVPVFSSGISVVGGKDPSEDNTFEYLTGQGAKFGIVINNKDNTNERIVRVYFAYDGAGQLMGDFQPGKQYNLRNSDGTIYPMEVVETDVPNVFYYEITGIVPGQTLSFTNTVQYPSPDTAGGTLRIWTKTLSPAEAQEKVGEVIVPTGDYLELDWDTYPTNYSISKNNSGVRENTSSSAALLTASVQANPAGEGTVRNLAWTITERTDSSTTHPTSEGLDYVLKADYEDMVDLPDVLYWRPEVLDVIENGPKLTTNADINDATKDGWWTTNKSIQCESAGTYSHLVLCVRSGGVTYDVAYMRKTSSSNSSGITNLTPVVVTEGGERKLKLSWYLTNSSSTVGSSKASEYGTQSFYLRVGDDVIMADLDSIDDAYRDDPASLQSIATIDNTITETRDYSYSPDQSTSATAKRVASISTGWNVDKVWQTNPYTYSYSYGGTNHYSIVKINNTGILSISQWGKLVSGSDDETDGILMTDDLNPCFFVTPANIEAMLNETQTIGAGSNAQQVPLGDWLTMTITKATLCTPEAYQQVDGVDQDDKYSISSVVQAGGDQSARVFEGATITITKNDDGLFEVTLAGDDTDNSMDGTYTAGEGGQYASVKDVFDAIGFFPTHNTRYSVKYQPDGPFTLRPGQELDITLRSTCKTTPMMLTRDNETQYPNLYETLSNQADVSANIAGQYETRRPDAYKGYSHYWQRELFLYKVGYLEGSNSQLNFGNSNPPVIPEGSVIDVNVYGFNNGSLEYDYMQFADHMNGCQVLLVPKAQNPALASAGLEEYESGGVTYYLLNKPGTYEGVVVGSTSRNGTQTYVTETITVELNGTGTSGSLDTTFKWVPLEKWGVTQGTSNNQTRIWYKVLVSAHKAGLVSSVEAEAGNEYQLRNRAWMGDHQGHRLYDTYGAKYDVFEHAKYIVDPDLGKGDGTDSVEAGTLVTESRITNGETVTYELDIHNITDVPVVITGSMMRDRLPYTYGVFDWSKANVSNIRYYAPEGTTITAGGHSLDTNGGANSYDDYWYIESSTTGSGANAQTNFDIRWNSDFHVSLPGSEERRSTLKILVDVTFPERPADGESKWDQYVSATKGAYLYNTFYFNGVPMQVRHTLEATGLPVLYKGVYDTGLTTHQSGTTDFDYGTYTSNRSRVRYVNGGGGTPSKTDSDLKAETVTYYTVLYNGSYDRLYLSDLQDQLPRGFVFNSFCNNSRNVTVVREWSFSAYNSRSNFTSKSSTSYSYNPVGWAGNVFSATDSYTLYQVFTEGTNNGSPLVTMNNTNSTIDNNTIKYVNAKVTATTSFNSEDGRQHITFTVGDAKGSIPSGNSRNSSQPTVHYDPKVKKYYLNPGEAIRFGYNCLVRSYSETDDLATNTIAMPYYDYYGTGFDLHTPSDEDGGSVQTVLPMTGINNNDGDCDLMTDTEVADQYHLDVDGYQDAAYKSKAEGNWLVSGVTLERAPVTPGIIKSVGGTTEENQSPTTNTLQGSNPSYSNPSLNGGTTSQFGTAYTGSTTSRNIVNWRLRMYNEAGGTNDDISGMLVNYEIVDTVAEPYAFTGSVFYNMYRTSNDAKTTYYTQYLFSIGSRTEGDTSVRIANNVGRSAAALSNQNPRNVNIGVAEDDSDDDWYEFGSGNSIGSVKIERNADGKEVMTIKLEGSVYAIPGGCYLQMGVHTQYTRDENAISDLKYNNVVLYPEQDYDPTRVAQGRARTKQSYNSLGQLIEENDGIQSGASVVLNQGFSTSSWKTVTQIGNTSNTASSNEDINYISLDEKCDTFRYDLYVVGPDYVMSKLVLIDDLPQIGDHSSFIEEDTRDSEFKVSFLEDNLAVTVGVAAKTGTERWGTEVVLKEGQYRVYVNTKTEFSEADWNGLPADWVDITELEGDELASALEGKRSIRIVIDDPNGYLKQGPYLMDRESRVHVGFNGRVDDPAARPGQIAWNSFGYRYTAILNAGGTPEASLDATLEAQPLNVGVRYPAAPSLEKRLVALEQKVAPKTEEVEVTKQVAVLDDEGNPVLDEDGNPTYIEVTETVTRVVTEPVERPVYDTTTGEQLFNEDGTPMTQLVDEPVMEPVYDDDGNAVMELKDHAASEDLTFEFLVYEGSAIPSLDDALDMTVADVMAAVEEAGRAYVHVPVSVAEGESSTRVNLQLIDYASSYDPETGEFTDNTGEKMDWHWKNLGAYTVVELPVGDYFYDLRTLRAGAATYERNNVTFANGNTRVVALVASNEWSPQYIDVTGKKVWDDADDQDGERPESVTVRLLADGEEVDSAEVSQETEWEFAFEHLLRFRETGEEIQYQVLEDAAPGYSVSYQVEEVEDEVSYVVEDDTAPTTGDDTGNPDDPKDPDADDPTADDDEPTTETVLVGYDVTVTNTHTPGQTSVSVAKVWDDGDDADGLRPASVTMRLLADGADTGKTIELTAADGWQGSFAGLDTHADGVEIAYTVVEDAVAEYEPSMAGDAAAGFVITNAHEPTPPVPTVKPRSRMTPRAVPGTGDPTSTAAIALLAGAGLALVVLGCLRRRNGSDAW